MQTIKIYTALILLSVSFLNSSEFPLISIVTYWLVPLVMGLKSYKPPVRYEALLVALLWIGMLSIPFVMRCISDYPKNETYVLVMVLLVVILSAIGLIPYLYLAHIGESICSDLGMLLKSKPPAQKVPKVTPPIDEETQLKVIRHRYRNTHIIDCSIPPFCPSDLSIRYTPNAHRFLDKFNWIGQSKNIGQYQIYAQNPTGKSTLISDIIVTVNDWGGTHTKLLPANVLDYLLIHQDQIPSDWREYTQILFLGTTYSDSNTGRVFVRSLKWFDGVAMSTNVDTACVA
jgi:hypothetical protein